MKNTEVFSSKAEKYARYRWDYALQAIEIIFDRAQLSKHSVVADIGAGTGILTKHFVGRVKRVFAVEPNGPMRQMAVEALGCHAHVTALRRTASGGFTLDGALPFERLDAIREEGGDEFLLPLEAGLTDLPEVRVRAAPSSGGDAPARLWTDDYANLFRTLR